MCEELAHTVLHSAMRGPVSRTPSGKSCSAAVYSLLRLRARCKVYITARSRRLCKESFPSFLINLRSPKGAGRGGGLRALDLQRSTSGASLAAQRNLRIPILRNYETPSRTLVFRHGVAVFRLFLAIRQRLVTQN